VNSRDPIVAVKVALMMVQTLKDNNAGERAVFGSKG